MDWTAIIVAVLACIGTAGGSIFGIMKTTSLVQYRLEELEKKVDLHNKVIERTYKLEARAAVIDEDIKVANHRIKDLEEKTK